MQLTQEIGTQYVGGQMEIQNKNEGYIYRGEIESITIKDGKFSTKFKWLAKGEGFPPLPNKWVRDNRLDYEADLIIYAVSNIGPSGGEIGGSDRLCLNSSIVGETVILYPPDGSKLDPSKVEGLQQTKALKTFAQFTGVHFALKDEVESVLKGEKGRLAVYKKSGDRAYLHCNDVPKGVEPDAIVIEILL